MVESTGLAAPPLNRTSSAPTAPASLSIPFLVVAALLIGAGIWLIFTWMLSFDWIYFGGVFCLAAGGLMLFSPRTGLDRSA